VRIDRRKVRGANVEAQAYLSRRDYVMDREPWSAASLARPTAVGTVGRTFRQLPAKGVMGAAYYDAHSFLSASDVVTQIKRGVATLSASQARQRSTSFAIHHAVPT
jgi:hypothetical protein